MKKSTIRLFKAVPITAKRTKKLTKELLEKTIKKGFIFSPEVVYNYSERELNDLIKIIEKEFGLRAEQMNSSFHKSWIKIKEASMEQLVMEQIIHYITTYGFERLEIYNEESVYIPNEKLEIPKLKEDINLIVINGYTKKELKEKLLKLLQIGIALGEDTIKDVEEVAIYVELDEEEVETIKNKEVKITLYDNLGIIPENPVEFLRYIIYKITGKTLLIKDDVTIEKIKEGDKEQLLNELFSKYKKKYGFERLAEIFYRFKPIFLSFRINPQLKANINKIRRLAKKYHKPMKEDYLNEITSKIKRGEKIDEVILKKELARVNNFRKIRLLYALKFRTKEVSSIIYKLRNGKGYATDFSFKNKEKAKKIFNIVMESITKDIKKNVKGKKIYIPEHITYTLPATEKQFTGDFPSGTYISIPKDMIFGVHWDNVNGNRIDLDLSLINPTGKMGWDSSYRTEDRSILFSGDVTSAPKPNGALELFYVKRQKMEEHILLVNYFNYELNIEVPFKIIVAKEKVSNFKNNYMVNPNNIITIAKSKINQKQKVLGLLVTTTNECRFYFAETYLGMSITSLSNEFIENARKYLFDFYRNTISLNDVLVKAGAKIVTNKEKCDIDLSPENLEKDKIINLIKN